MPRKSFLERTLGRAIDVALIAIAGFLAVLVFYNVIARYILRSSLYWSDELETILLVWSTFLGTVAAFRYKAHLAITEIINRVPPRVRYIIEIYTHVAILIFVVLLVVYGTSISVGMMKMLTMGLEIPYGYVYAAMPVSGVFLLLFVLESIMNLLFRKPQNRESEPLEESKAE